MNYEWDTFSSVFVFLSCLLSRFCLSCVFRISSADSHYCTTTVSAVYGHMSNLYHASEQHRVQCSVA